MKKQIVAASLRANKNDWAIQSSALWAYEDVVEAGKENTVPSLRT